MGMQTTFFVNPDGSITVNLEGSITIGAVQIADATTPTQKVAVDASGNMSVKLGVAIPAGTNIIGKFGIDQTTPGTTNGVQVNAALPAGTNTIGSVSGAASTTGGTSTYAALGGTGNALLTNTATAVKASAGNLYGFSFQNPNTSAVYVQFFNTASGSVTVGTTVPVLSFWVPANGAYDLMFNDESKVSFSSAITVAATTTATGNTAPSTGITANIIYK